MRGNNLGGGPDQAVGNMESPDEQICEIDVCRQEGGDAEGCKQDRASFYAEHASLRKRASVLMTGASFSLIVAILWVIMAHLVLGLPPESRSGALLSLIAPAAVMAPWLILRRVSDWYVSLGRQTDSVPVFVAVVCLTVVILLFGFLRIREARAAKVTLATLVGSVTLVEALIRWFPSVFEQILPIWVSLHGASLYGVAFLLLSVPALGAIYLLTRMAGDGQADLPAGDHS